jgi:hypothetical protein
VRVVNWECVGARPDNVCSFRLEGMRAPQGWQTILIAALAVPLGLDGEVLPIRSYTTADGLAANRVDCIVPDSRGFIWFCTPEGLSRFDGYRIVSYGRVRWARGSPCWDHWPQAARQQRLPRAGLTHIPILAGGSAAWVDHELRTAAGRRSSRVIQAQATRYTNGVGYIPVSQEIVEYKPLLGCLARTLFQLHEASGFGLGAGETLICRALGAETVDLPIDVVPQLRRGAVARVRDHG